MLKKSKIVKTMKFDEFRGWSFEFFVIFFAPNSNLKKKNRENARAAQFLEKTPAIRHGVFPRNWAARAFSRFFFFKFEFGAKKMTKNSKLHSKLTKCTTFYWCSIICMFKSTVSYELKLDDLIFKIRIMNACIWLIFRIKKRS